MVMAAGFAKVGTFGGQFLKIGVSARATGMGRPSPEWPTTPPRCSGTPVDWSTSWGMRSPSIMWTGLPIPSSARPSWPSTPVPFPEPSPFSVRSFWMDPQLVRTAYNPEGTGETFDSGSTTFGVSYARFFTDKFSAGFTLNYLHMGLAETAVNSAAFDFGIMYRIGIKDLKLGMTIQNLGGNFTFDERESKLPVAFKVEPASTRGRTSASSWPSPVNSSILRITWSGPTLGWSTACCASSSCAPVTTSTTIPTAWLRIRCRPAHRRDHPHAGGLQRGGHGRLGLRHRLSVSVSF